MADRNELLPIPLPMRGLNTIEGLTIPWDSGYAREFTNYSLYAGKPYIRPAIRNAIYNTTLSGLGRTVHWFEIGSSYNAILNNGDIRDLLTNSGATNIGGNPIYNATTVKHVSLNLVIGCRQPRLAASPFTAWTFTTSVVTDTDIRCACSHKGRLYVFNSSSCEYSSIAQVTGAMPTGFTFPFAEYLDGQNILRAFSLTVQPGDDSQNVMAIFSDGGRVIIYAGDYPGSSTWQLIGKFDMSSPISNVGFLEIDGDVWVSGLQYAYWARDLFSGGSQTAHANAPSAPIENIWQGVGWNSSYLFQEVSHVFYEPRLDAIITQCSEKTGGPNNFALLAEYQNEAIYFAYFRKNKAWAVWFAAPIFAPVLASAGTTNLSVLYGTGYLADISTMVHGNIRDQSYLTSAPVEQDIETSWKTPYYASGGRGYRINGVRPFFENTISGYFEKIRVIFNYSDFNSVLGWYTQSPITQVNPANYGDSNNDAAAVASNQYTALMGATGSGGSFSIQFTQKPKASSSSTQSQSIYAANAYIEPGNNLF